jgi:hypothetical protein
MAGHARWRQWRRWLSGQRLRGVDDAFAVGLSAVGARRGSARAGRGDVRVVGGGWSGQAAAG